jgi:hypothetical protein
MQTFIILFTFITFYSVAVMAGLQDIINVAKCTADIPKEIPKCGVFIMKCEGEGQGENIFIYFPFKIGAI